MKYVLTTHDKLRFILDDDNYSEFLKALQENSKAYVIKKYKAVIPLHITPSVVPFEIWYAQENERLALSNHRLCKDCLCIMNIFDKCKCWKEMGVGEEKNAFVGKLPESVKLMLEQTVSPNGFPQVTNKEIYKETDWAKVSLVKKLITGGDDLGDFYINEDGEKTYS